MRDDGEEDSMFVSAVSYVEGKDVSKTADSLIEKQGFAEPALADAQPGERFQFFRHGYYYADPKDHKAGEDSPLVFNRIVDLKSSYKPKNA